ncbi:hypothetical protein [Persicitalea jodogahamensis]|nr:hypothetical protein [Persicitalea jodogahamensis]
MKMMDNMNGNGFMGMGMWIGGLVLLVLILLAVWLFKKISNKG